MLYAWHEVDERDAARVVVVDRRHGTSASHSVLHVVFGEGTSCATEDDLTSLIFSELEELIQERDEGAALGTSRKVAVTPPERRESTPPGDDVNVSMSLEVGARRARYKRRENYPKNEGNVPPACSEFNQRFRAHGCPWIAWPRIGEENGADLEIVTKERGLAGPTLGVQHTVALLHDAGHDASKGSLSRDVDGQVILKAVEEALSKKSPKASPNLALAVDLVDLSLLATLWGPELTDEIRQLAENSRWSAVVVCGGGMPGYAGDWVLHPVPEGQVAPVPVQGFPGFQELLESDGDA